MFVELIYDKRNVSEIPNASARILAELTKRVHITFPTAEVKVKPMQANEIKTDASKSQKATLSEIVQEMFDDANEWLVTE